MASNERIRKYLDAGTVLGQVSRGRAEEIVRELVNAGDIQRSQAQEWVDNLTDRSRRSSEQVLDLVRHEVAAQLEKLDRGSLEHLANQVAEILKKSADAGRQTTRDVTTQAGKVTKHAGRAAKDVRSQAGKTAKTVRTQADKTAKGVRTQADKTAKTVRTQAGRTAQGVWSQTGTAATRARAAATKVTPVRGGKGSSPKASGKNSGAHTSASDKTDKTNKTNKKADKKAEKKADMKPPKKAAS